MARPSFAPTPEQRDLVRKLAGVGLPHDDIARLMPGGAIDPKTLRKHFAEALETGGAECRANAHKRLHSMIAAGNVAALIFFLKTQCGWRETTRVEATGADGEPLAAPAPGVVVYLPRKDPLDPGMVAAEAELGRERRH